jgi:hypothetical protein
MMQNHSVIKEMYGRHGDADTGALNVTIKHILASTSTFGVGQLRGADQ